MSNPFEPKKRYHINVTAEQAKMAMEEWIWRGYPCDVKLRKSKDKGCCVIVVEADGDENPSAIYWANHVVLNSPGCKVHIEPIKNKNESNK